MRLWVSPGTFADLKALTGGDISQVGLSAMIAEHASEPAEPVDGNSRSELAQPVEITTEAYALLTNTFPSGNDEQRIQALMRAIKSRP